MLSRLASPTAEATTARKIIEGIQTFPNAKKVVRKIQTPSNGLVSRETARPRRINGGWDLSLVEWKVEDGEEEAGEGGRGRRRNAIF
jgi:hypothetical protein